ncbi:MAG: ATP-binding protein [Caldilineaceae bacterium]
MTSSIRILLIEDDPADRIQLEEVLDQALLSSRNAPQCSVAWAQSLAEGIELSTRRACDVIIADLNLGDTQGIQTIEQLTAAVDSAPIVLLTGFIDEELTFNVARYGIQDYLVKGEFDGALLLRTLRFAIDRYRLERRQRAMSRIELVSQQPDELQPLLDYVVDAVAELLPTSAGVAIVFHDAARGELVLGAATSHCLHANDDVLKPTCHRIVATGETETVGNVSNHALTEVRALAAHAIHAYIGVPILQEQRCLGVLFALESSSRIYTQNDVDFMQTLSNRVALAISRVELYEQMRNQTRDLSVRNTELDAFSYTVAHDLRNLLASVIGYAELLADDFDIVTPADRARYIDTIISHGYKMKQVIDSLLMLARLRTMDMEMDVVDMQSVVKEVTHRLQDHFVETKANIHILGDWPAAIGHAGWLEEVWVNYVTNALKYGGAPPRVVLGATVQGQSVRFWVCDNGSGITPADQARLFEPFVRLQPTRADGHGLGLSIVRRIVERCNGNVGVESTPGEGSTFWFELPAYAAGASSESVAKPIAMKARM